MSPVREVVSGTSFLREISKNAVRHNNGATVCERKEFLGNGIEPRAAATRLTG
jgi:hypothetical protein